MAKNRVPKKGDRVGASGRTGVFVVANVHGNPMVVDLRSLKAAKELGPIETGIPWSTLVFLDEEDASQAAAQIVREATEKD